MEKALRIFHKALECKSYGYSENVHIPLHEILAKAEDMKNKDGDRTLDSVRN